MTLPRHLLALVIFVIAGAAFAEPARVVVISDLNGSYGSTEYDPRVSNAVDAIIALHPDVVISTGDMVAGQRRPVLSEREVRAMWEAFHNTVTIPLENAGIPLAVTPGNHDASAYGGFERKRDIFAETWRARRRDLDFLDGSNYPFFYAFDIRGARFASLDATVVGRLPATQMQWLEAAMHGTGSARVVFSHLPLWPFAVGRETEIIADPALEALFRKTGIDLHLSGHHHAFYPGAVAGIGVISQACLGSGPRALIGETRTSAHAITVLDISETGEIVLSARTGEKFEEVLDIERLPASITTRHRVIERLDRAMLDDVTVISTSGPLED